MATASEQISSAAVSAPSASRPATKLKRVLVVDKPRFSALVQRMLTGRFDVVCVEDVVEAIKASKIRRPDLVICELGVRGGGLRLAELLDMNVKAVHTPFILTCIKPSSDLVERATRAGIDEVLIKPFPPSALQERAGSALSAPVFKEDESDEQGVADAIKNRLGSIDGLPPFPATHAKILELTQSEDSSSEDIAEQIQMDPSFLANLLKLANSSHYGFRRQVDSLKLAVSLVGQREIANLTMSLQVFQQLGNYESKSDYGSMAFWKHSVGTAFISRIIAQKLQAEVEFCFMAGLLHDVGKMVLNRFFPEFFTQVLETVQEDEVHSTHAELDLLGLTHSHVGGYLAANWEFADTLTEAIVCHHDPSRAEHFPKLASVVQVANAICNLLEYGTSGEVVKQEVEDPVLSKALWKLGVGPSGLEALIDLGKAQLEDEDSFLGALGGGKG